MLEHDRLAPLAQPPPPTRCSLIWRERIHRFRFADENQAPVGLGRSRRRECTHSRERTHAGRPTGALSFVAMRARGNGERRRQKRASRPGSALSVRSCALATFLRDALGGPVAGRWRLIRASSNLGRLIANGATGRVLWRASVQSPSERSLAAVRRQKRRRRAGEQHTSRRCRLPLRHAPIGETTRRDRRSRS